MEVADWVGRPKSRDAEEVEDGVMAVLLCLNYRLG